MVMTAAIAAGLGLLSGLGIGGGSLLMLWLTLGLGMAPAEARILNLMFFLPSALVSACFRLKQGSLPLRTVWPAMVSGAGAAFVCSCLSSRLDTVLLKKAFGALLLVTGIREIRYRPKK